MLKKMKNGFTLIEILISVSIVGILSAIVILAIANPREDAQSTGVQYGLTQVRNLAAIYTDGGIKPLYKTDEEAYNRPGDIADGVKPNFCTDKVEALLKNTFGLDSSDLKYISGNDFGNIAFLVNKEEVNERTRINALKFLCLATPNKWLVAYNLAYNNPGGISDSDTRFWCIDSEDNVGELGFPPYRIMRALYTDAKAKNAGKNLSCKG